MNCAIMFSSLLIATAINKDVLTMDFPPVIKIIIFIFIMIAIITDTVNYLKG